jgi:hypothetical protein
LVIPETESELESSSDPVPGSPIAQSSILHGPNNVSRRLTKKSRSRLPVLPDLDSPPALEKSFEGELAVDDRPRRLSPKNVSNRRSPELVILNSDSESDSEEECWCNSVQHVQPSLTNGDHAKNCSLAVFKRAKDPVEKWVLSNTKNFKRRSSSSTLATFREFVENDAASSTTGEETQTSSEPGKKTDRRKSR